MTAAVLRVVGPRRRRTHPVSPVVTRLWPECWAGTEPAEALDTGERELLVAFLHEAGHTDLQIAARTRMTLYTTARIRDRIGLAANAPVTGDRGGGLPVAELAEFRDRFIAGEPLAELAAAYRVTPDTARRLVRDVLDLQIARTTIPPTTIDKVC